MKNLARTRMLVPAAIVAATASVALAAAPASANANRVVVNPRLYPAGTLSVDVESSNPDGSPALSNCVNVRAGQSASVNVFVENGTSVNINFYRNQGCGRTISWATRRAPDPVASVWNINS
ncbi:hypothetical protein SAMN04487983_103270 [Streptomyces sp. yr375]|uniref:hypothetical protein n=1 Tax=Streptomyces sp. yr375 TaxID=1761906 RepID=UPI0008B7431D|nr:hypothetical protein [Streptomyces sp. yr375]SES13734.1 hypothetical protein SAMN04487983_103270 [Streptomyces sp. yr375]